jgi:hypothetical protein
MKQYIACCNGKSLDDDISYIRPYAWWTYADNRLYYAPSSDENCSHWGSLLHLLRVRLMLECCATATTRRSLASAGLKAGDV